MTTTDHDPWCPDHDSGHCRVLFDLDERLQRLEGHAPPPERAILTDLIAELKPLRQYHLVDSRLMSIPLEHAEQRLKGLTDE